jgi:pimeloyl-ACP methyl ester carboxylesterase
MTRFVVVAGAWLGAWAWDEVVPELREAGHEVHALTLSGLAERQDVPAGQQTHVQDIVDEVERLDLRDVVLVGHSYAGVPVGQAAELIGDRLARVVFVDSNVPVDGKSFLDSFPSGHIRKSLDESGRPLADLPATYVKCLLDGDELPAPADELVASGRWELVRMETGHWPMFSRPRELARVLDESATRS